MDRFCTVVALAAALFLVVNACAAPTPRTVGHTTPPYNPYECRPTVLFHHEVDQKEDQFLFCRYSAKEKSLLCSRSMAHDL